MSTVLDDQEVKGETAAVRTARLLTVIRSAECEQTLDWLERQVERQGWGSLAVTLAMRRQRAWIASRPARLF